MQVFMGSWRSGPPPRRNPSPVGEKFDLSIYPSKRHREGVDAWLFLLGFVRLIYWIITNQHFMCSVARFHARHPKWGFSPLSARTYYGVRGASEAGRTSEMYLGFHKLTTHYYTYIRCLCKFWWGLDTPDPLYGETLQIGRASCRERV